MFATDSLQKAMRFMTKKVMEDGFESSPRGLKIKEIICPKVIIENPRNRWISFKSRKMDITYAIGELFWYLSGTNRLDFIQYYAPSIGKYSDDGKTLNSAYGYLFFNKWGNQVKGICDVLTKDPDSRQAIVLLREPADVFKDTKDQVCTVSLQFFIRENKLHLVVYMRSNDLFVGFMYDIFCFTMIQEIIACKIRCELGNYYHVPGSLHIYEPMFEKAYALLNEKNDKFNLGSMSFRGDIFDYINELCEYEEKIRLCDGDLDKIIMRYHNKCTDYWKQIFDVLLYKKIKKREDPLSVSMKKTIINELSSFQNTFFIDYLLRK